MLIKKILGNKQGKWGYRTVCMNLEEKMNHKKVLRIMRKYGLAARIRRANPYRQMAKKTHEHRVLPNILNRNFEQDVPRSVLCTDVTYIPLNNRFAYLSVVKDVATKEIAAWHMSLHPDMELVTRTIDKLKKDPHVEKNAMIHSDQGFQYTNPEYISLMERLEFVQSMSRKGNCIDNAPIESFFGHFKDEVDHKSARSFLELYALVDNYIEYYNNQRKQWEIKKMTPVEYRDHLLMK